MTTPSQRKGLLAPGLHGVTTNTGLEPTENHT